MKKNTLVKRGHFKTWLVELASKHVARSKLAKALRLASVGAVTGLWGAWKEQIFEVAFLAFCYFLVVQLVAFIVEPPDSSNAKKNSEKDSNGADST